MSDWRQPKPSERGMCRCRPHESKEFETGFQIFGWRDDGMVIVKKDGCYGVYNYPVEQVEICR